MRDTRYDKTGLTIVEMIIAIAIMVIVFAAIVPQFRVILNSWDSKAGLAETIQNGRVLIDHINRNLAKAVKVTAVSSSSETNGYIEFQDNDDNTLRYDINSVSNYVEYGLVGGLSDLAGPVSQLQFTCYDACDFDTAIMDVNDIRFVKVQTTLTNSATLGNDETFIASAYLLTNGNVIPGSSTEATYDYSNRTQGTDVFAYDGEGNQKVPADSTSPSNVLSSGEYDDIEYNDGVFHSYNVLSNNAYAQIRFVIQIDEEQGDATQIDLTWNGRCINTKSSSTDGASFYIWNYTSSDYELLEESADTEAEVTLTGTLTSSITNYIGGAGEDTVILLVASNSKKPNKDSLTLYTDYVKLEVAATSAERILP